MEEEIKIEKLYCYTRETLEKTIINLIARNKELEKHYEHEQEYINGEVFSAKQMHFIDDEYIPKSKIKEKIEELEQFKKDISSEKDDYYCEIIRQIKLLQELLED